MKDRRAGISLMELLVVMAALMVVMAMGFEIFGASARSVSRGLSLTARADRLRLLQRMVDRDLASRYGTSETSSLSISSASEVSGPAELLRTEILEEGDNGVEIREVIYSLKEDPRDIGRIHLFRTVDPDLAPGEGSEAEIKALFSLGPTESLVWETVASPSTEGPDGPRLRIGLKDSRHTAWHSERRMLLVGYQP